MIGVGGQRWARKFNNNNIHRHILVKVALSHTGLYCGKIIGEYLEKRVDRKHPPERAVKLIACIMGAFESVPIVTQNAPCIQPTQTIRFSCYVLLMGVLIPYLRRSLSTR
jgi:hypothetical protein